MENPRLKFRVWYKPYNGYVEIRDNLVLLPNGILCEYDGIEIDSDNYIIEMCTGLKDKNGKLIYEGDVVYDSVYENNFVVSWDNDRTGYILSANNTNHIDYLSKILIERHNLKIIGNIHEQAEQKD